MADPQIDHSGERRQVGIALATVVKRGDLIGLTAGLAVKYTGAGATFLGVSEDDSKDNEEEDISVLGEGTVLKIDAASDTYLYGAPLQQGTANDVIDVTAGEHIMTVVRPEGVAVTRVRAELIIPHAFRT